LPDGRALGRQDNFKAFAPYRQELPPTVREAKVRLVTAASESAGIRFAALRQDAEGSARATARRYFFFEAFFAGAFLADFGALFFVSAFLTAIGYSSWQDILV
jgi:hypothetical protein